MRAAGAAGHETGVHGWDHVGWHDRLDRMSAEEVAGDYGRAHAEYLRILGAPARRAPRRAGRRTPARSRPRRSAALLYTSDTRGGGPFFPRAGGRVFRTLEMPTTLPTLDETLAWPELSGATRTSGRTSAPPCRGTEVHTIHTEVEGRSKAALFARILDDWRADGVALRRSSRSSRARPSRAASGPRARDSRRSRLPGRGGHVATGWPEPGRAG